MTATTQPAAEPGSARPDPVSLGAATLVWLRVAALSFGGPAGQIAVMHRILVDEQRWIGERRFLHALNYCMVLPGPEAQQLATYIGWLMHRTLGGVIAGTLFVLPGAVTIMALSWIYVLYGHTLIVSALFFGLKAAVLAVVLNAVVRVGKRALHGRFATGIAAAAFVALFLFSAPFPLVVLTAGIVGWAAARAGWWMPAGAGHGGKAGGVDDAQTVLGEELPPHAHRLTGPLTAAAVTALLWLAPVGAVVAIFGPDNVFSRIATFFSGAALVTFGGAYAVLAYVAQAAVDHYHWLRPGEMLDGLGMAETTPGPLIMVLQYVGFLGAYRDPGALSPLMAGTLGGLLATWVTFAPCFLWIFLGAPFVERLRHNSALNAALSGITAAVVGVILNLAIWFAVHTLFRQVQPFAAGPVRLDVPVPTSLDPWSLLIAVGAVVAMFRFKAGVMTTLAVAAGLGVALALAGLR